MQSNFSLLLGDAKKLIGDVPDHSIDLICTDPPYNLTKYARGNIRFSKRADRINEIAAWDLEDFNPEDWLAEFTRVLKPDGNIFSFTSYNHLGRWHSVFDPVFDTFQIMVWHKTNPAPNFLKKSFLNSCELIACAWNKKHIWNFTTQDQMHNFIQSPICMGKERLNNPKHPTQKPVAVIKKIIEIASNPGGTVLDPFAGVASVGVAALQTGRRYVGFEINESYHKAGITRLETEAGISPLQDFNGSLCEFV